MTDQERKEMVATLDAMAETARTLSRFYEEAAETVAGFRTEEEYQAFASESFEAAQSSVDAWPEMAR